MGIRVDDVIHALSALTIQDPQRVKTEEHSTTLSPITEEKTGFNRFSGPVDGGTRVWEERGGGEGGEGEGEGGRRGVDGGKERERRREETGGKRSGGYAEEKESERGRERGGEESERESITIHNDSLDPEQSHLTWEPDDVH